MGKHSNKNRGKKNQTQNAGQSTAAKRKKELKVFKLPTEMGKRLNKKAKKVETKLKKVPIGISRFKVPCSS